MGTNQRKRRSTIKQNILFVCALALLAIAAVWYNQYYFSSRRVEAIFKSAAGVSSPAFSLEIAKTNGERAKGLMFRKAGDLAANEGMLFVYPAESEHFFWMKNTYIPLDMIFVGANMKVAGVLKDVPPHSEQARSVGAPSQYIIELLAGTAARFGIAAGDEISLLPVVSTTE